MPAAVGLALGAEIPVAADGLDLCAWTGVALERPAGHSAAPVERVAVRPGIHGCPPHLEGA